MGLPVNVKLVGAPINKFIIGDPMLELKCIIAMHYGFIGLGCGLLQF